MAKIREDKEGNRWLNLDESDLSVTELKAWQAKREADQLAKLAREEFERVMAQDNPKLQGKQWGYRFGISVNLDSDKAPAKAKSEKAPRQSLSDFLAQMDR